MGGKFDTYLEQEMKAVYAGKYGKKGAREAALRNLQSKYPGIADSIAEVIYGSEKFDAAFPDGYEGQIITGKETEQFLTKGYFRNLYTDEMELKKAAKEAGFSAGGFMGIGTGEEGVKDYLDYLMKIIEQYRSAGYDDKEILKMMK